MRLSPGDQNRRSISRESRFVNANRRGDTPVRRLRPFRDNVSVIKEESKVSIRLTTAAMLAATTAIIAPANAQIQQTAVKVDNKDYTVTEMRGGRTGHMVQLAGPEGTAMVMINNDNNITAYKSPPGGGGLQDFIN